MWNCALASGDDRNTESRAERLGARNSYGLGVRTAPRTRRSGLVTWFGGCLDMKWPSFSCVGGVLGDAGKKGDALWREIREAHFREAGP